MRDPGMVLHVTAKIPESKMGERKSTGGVIAPGRKSDQFGMVDGEAERGRGLRWHETRYDNG